MRGFIGLDLSAKEKLALDEWRNKAFSEVLPRKKHASEHHLGNTPAQPYSIPAANYHITLCFLGNINPAQIESLCLALDEVRLPPFDVHLDITGFWAGPKIVFAAPSSVPKALIELAKASRKAARASHITIENKDYQPHVTLIRKANATLPPPLFLPDINVSATRFHLFESVSTPSGVHYPIRHSWDLTGSSSSSIREQLRRGQL